MRPLTSRIRSFARSAAVQGYTSAVAVGGLDRRLLRRLGRAGGLLVLNLHNVGPAGSRFSRPIPPDVFDEFVGWLRSHCRLTTFSDLAGPADGDERPQAVLSFDDGYRDFVDYAMPILEKHGVRANQNVIPGCVESGRPPWNVDLLDALDRQPAERLRGLRLSAGELPPLGASDADVIRWGVAVSRILKLRPRSERESLLSELRSQIDLDSEHEPQPMMSAAEVTQAAAAHEIGVHSFDHDSMEYESDAFFADDVRRCQGWYRAHVGGDARVYAFPNGSYREPQIAVAEQAGIEHVLLVGERTSRVGARVHPRVTADGVSLPELRMRIARAS